MREPEPLDLISTGDGHVDPTELLDGFRSVVEHGAEVPTSLLRWVASAFGRYLSGQAETLDDAFAVASAGQGRPTGGQRFRRFRRDLREYVEIYELKHWLGVSDEVAAAMVAARLEAIGERRSSRSILNTFRLMKRGATPAPSLSYANESVREDLTRPILERYPPHARPPTK